VLTLGFQWSFAQPCLCINNTSGIILLVYVDDIADAAKSKIQLQYFVETISTIFNAKNLRKIKKLLKARVTNRFGIAVEKNKSINIANAD
jgi:hypothetical protein